MNPADILTVLNNRQPKEYLKPTDMTINQEYQIVDMKRISSKYGERILVESSQYKIQLPERYNYLTSEIMETLAHDGNYYIKFTGLVGKAYRFEFTYKEPIVISSDDAQQFNILEYYDSVFPK